MQAKAFTRLNRFPSQKQSFIKCEATNRYSAWIIHGNENTSTSCSIITKNAQDWQQHRMELCHSVNWTIIEWSEKVAECHRYAIQLPLNWLNGRDSFCAGCRRWDYADWNPKTKFLHSSRIYKVYFNFLCSIHKKFISIIIIHKKVAL